jgi:hypothetical protein
MARGKAREMADITTTRDGEHGAHGHRTHPRTVRWAMILAGGDGTRLRDLARGLATAAAV